MKVGLFVGKICPTDGGGYTYVAELLSALSEKLDGGKHQFFICHEGAEEVTRAFSKYPQVDLLGEKWSVLSSRERLFQFFPSSFERSFNLAFRIRVEKKWDERVYAKHGIQFLINLVPWSSPTLELPFAVVVWDLQHRNNPWFPEISGRGEWIGRERKYEQTLRRASYIYTGTNVGKREIIKFYQVPEERIRVLPFPAPAFAVQCADVPCDPDFIEKNNLPKRYLFYPAQFWPHKNHVVVLEACRLVRDETGIDLGVVFTGSDKGNIEYIRNQVTRLGLERCVRILGFVSQDELVQLYKNAICMTFATFCGPDNLPPLEAFALGCPVIASSVQGAEEQLGDAALLFSAGDEHSLKNRIIEILGKLDTPRLIEAGYKRIATLTWSNYAESMVQSLDEFMEIRRAWE